MKNNTEAIKKQNNEQMSSRRFLTVFICIFLSLVLIFGAVLGAILALRNSRSYVKYKSVSMDGEILSFFESYYKSQYIRYLKIKGVADVDDTPAFWDKKDESGKTYGEGLIEGTQNYISQIMTANYLYDAYSSLTDYDKDVISNAAEEKLEFLAKGDKGSFNLQAGEYGFDYSSYKKAVKMIYKAAYAKDVIYGQGGAKLEGYPELAGEYLSEYTHVKLLFIRTETTFILDAGGNRIKDNDGNDATRPLTDDEKIARTALLSEIRGYIDAIGTGEAQMGEVMFNNYLEKNDEGDRDMHGDGYYFHENSHFTAEFAEKFENIIDKAYSMETGTFGEVALDFGVCFIYKQAPTEGAYILDSNEVFFEDFYENAANMLYNKNINELLLNVTFTDKYMKDEVIERAYTSIYFPAF